MTNIEATDILTLIGHDGIRRADLPAGKRVRDILRVLEQDSYVWNEDVATDPRLVLTVKGAGILAAIKGFSCALNRDGSRTTMLCSVHAETDPCLTMASVTGKRRKGTIRRGKCTQCGWTGTK